MKKELTNAVHIEGYLYEHKLEKKISGENSKNPGLEYIRGELKIATDEELTNIVSIYWVYQQPNWKNGPNTNFQILNGIINGETETYMSSTSKDLTKIPKVKIDGRYALNDFATESKTVKGEIEIASPSRIEGSFIHIVPSINPDEMKRCIFNVDVILGKLKIKTVIDPMTEEEIERMYLSGYTFDDYNKRLLPIEMVVIDNEGAKGYFESLEISEGHPVFTTVKGATVYKDIIKKITVEGAFSTEVIERPTKTKDFVVTWASGVILPFGDDEEAAIGGFTTEEFKTWKGNRETYLSELIERKKTALKEAEKPSAFGTVPTGDYKFGF